MKLLVPTDFSKNAATAIDYAIRVAVKSGAKIVLLHAHETIATGGKARFSFYEEYDRAAARQLHDELKNLKSKLARRKPAIQVSAEFFDDNVQSSIIHAANKEKADLIIMGTQGASGFKNLFMGSVTAAVIGKTTVPVLAIPRLHKWREPKNILLATNRFEEDPAILKPVFTIAKLFNAILHIIVFSDTDTAVETELLNNKKKLEQYKRYLQKKLKDIHITSQHLTGSKFEETLQQYMDSNAIDMLAMITQKRSLWNAIFNRSITKKMSYRTTIPLLAIPGVDD